MLIAIAVFNEVWFFRFRFFVSLQNDFLEVLKFVLKYRIKGKLFAFIADRFDNFLPSADQFKLLHHP